jgi:uncharacterized protein
MNIYELNKGLLLPTLRMGVVSSVNANIARINLKNAGAPSGTYFETGRYGLGEVGEFVLIEGQQSLILGRIVEIRLPERDRRSVSQDYTGATGLDAIGNIQLLGSVSMADDLSVTAGVDAYPRLGDRVYAAQDQFVALIPTLMEPATERKDQIRLELGFVGQTQAGVVTISPEKLFGRHCAILGATGGGKSWTTARIIEECLKYKAKIILFDPSGEYRGISGVAVTHCHLGDPVHKADGSIACSLPPTCFQESDFIALFDPAGKVQGPKFRAAIRSLRLAKLEPNIAPGGFIKKINQKKDLVTAAEIKPGVSEKLDDPRQEFDVKHLVSQIEQECVWPDGFNDTTKWGKEDGNFSHCLSLVTRINGVLISPAFSCVFNCPQPSLTEQVDSFLAEEGRLLRICLSGISYEYKAREIIANAIGRYLLNKARLGSFRKHPLIVFVDEAHNFLGRSIGAEDSMARLDAFEFLAKEGRKFGVNICLATQRPRDITVGVLSQMGTLLVHRLTNDRDREVVEKACGEIDRSASAFLPNLKPGEAAIIGVDFPIPLTIQMKKPTHRPESEGPSYQKYWKIQKDIV